MAQAQTSGSAGAPVGAGRTGITGSSSVVTPPASTGVGVSGAPSGSTSQTAQPSMDINRAQQPGIGVNTGGSGNGSTR